MAAERVLVVGLGEIGRPLYELVAESGRYEVYGYDIVPARTVNRLEEIPGRVDILHICIPYTDGFTGAVKDYVERFNPGLVVIHSTVAPGTTRTIHMETGRLVAYSPVRGKHPNIKKHLLFWPKWVAGVPGEAVEQASRHLELIGLRVRVAGSPESLEIAKLWETVYRALMIAGWQEVHRVARKYGADIGVVAEFVAEVHEVLGDRPVYYPAHIGGHCLIPNTEIMSQAYPSPLWQFILESNEKRRREQEDPEVRRGIERVKKVWERLVPRWYYRGEAPPAEKGRQC